MSKRKKALVICALLADVLWIGFILSRSLKTAEKSSVESGYVLTFIRQFIPSVTDHVVRKLAHFTEFFILGGLLSWTGLLLFPRKLLLSCLPGFAVAATDELIQRGVPGRSGELRDALLDCAGVLAACLLALLLRRLRRNHHRHRQEGSNRA